MKRIVILQPSYMPWIGYFDQILKSDHFVFLDDVLYTKNDWRNRNKIKTSNGTEWLTLPINMKNRITKKLLIKDIEIKNPQILTKHLKTIELNYKKAKYFNEFYPLLEKLFKKNHILLSELNIQFVYLVLDYLGIKNKKFSRSSELKIDRKNSTERLVAICKFLKATHYLTGDSAKNYLDEKMFSDNKIKLEYHNYKHPRYSQLWDEFIPFMSIVDILFNEGKKTKKILKHD
jgi:hypothetical protein